MSKDSEIKLDTSDIIVVIMAVLASILLLFGRPTKNKLGSESSRFVRVQLN